MRCHGEMRPHLPRQGTPFDPNDGLFAAHVMASDLRVVTRNERELTHPRNFRVNDWLTDPESGPLRGSVALESHSDVAKCSFTDVQIQRSSQSEPRRLAMQNHDTLLLPRSRPFIVLIT